jgi:serine/threonine protein kinase
MVLIPVAVAWSILNHATTLHLEKQALERMLAMQDQRPTPAPLMSAAGSPLAIARPAEFYIDPALGNVPVAVDGERQSPAIPNHLLLRKIGRGSYGDVWVAKDVIGTYQAVKVVYRVDFLDAGPYDREFRGIQKFTPISRSHDNFVHVLHVGRNEGAGYFYYIMELADDVKTAQKIEPNQYVPRTLASDLSNGARRTPPECLRLALYLTSALDHLHQHQLIHRDIKPSNIIFIRDRPKLADLGLVTDIGGTGKDVSILGTHGYIAPEGPGSPGADLYSLGKVLYEALTGLDRARFPELPTAIFEVEGDSMLIEINRVILKACEPEPAKRYKTATEMRSDLLDIEKNFSSGRTTLKR